MIISFFIALFITLILYFVSQSVASFVFSLFIIATGILSGLLLKKEYRQTGLKLFYIVFSVYAVFALIHYLEVLQFNNYIFPDEYGSFLPWANSLANNSSISAVFNEAYSQSIHVENRGYLFYIGVISYLAQNFLDGNSELLLFLSSVLFGALFSLALYRFLLFYTTIKESFKYSLLFLLFSPIVPYSFSLLRDIHIAFFYLCGFIIVSKKFSVKGLLLLILLTFLTWNFRYEHGIFYIIILLYYLYTKFKRNKIIIFIIILFGSLLFIEQIVSNVFRIQYTYSIYSEISSDVLQSAGGDSLGKLIRQKLPSPLKEIFILLYSQISPFPSWIYLSNSNNIYGSIISILHICYTFFWFTVLYSFSKWFFLKKKHIHIDSNLKLLLIIAVILIISNIVNINHRRIMVVYPIIYLVYVIINTQCISQNQITKTIFSSSLVYLSLIVVYIIIKYT